MRYSPGHCASLSNLNSFVVTSTDLSSKDGNSNSTSINRMKYLLFKIAHAHKYTNYVVHWRILHYLMHTQPVLPYSQQCEAYQRDRSASCGFSHFFFRHLPLENLVDGTAKKCRKSYTVDRWHDEYVTRTETTIPILQHSYTRWSTSSLFGIFIQHQGAKTTTAAGAIKTIKPL